MAEKVGNVVYGIHLPGCITTAVVLHIQVQLVREEKDFLLSSCKTNISYENQIKGKKSVS